MTNMRYEYDACRKVEYVEKKDDPQVQPRKDIDVSWYKRLKVVWTEIGNDNKMYLWWVVYSVFNDSKQYRAPRFGLLLQAASHSRVISGGGESEWGWFKRWLDRWPGCTHWAARSLWWGGLAALFCSTSSLYIRTFRFFPDSLLSNKLGLNALVVMLKIAHDVYIYTQIIVIVMWLIILCWMSS